MQIYHLCPDKEAKRKLAKFLEDLDGLKEKGLMFSECLIDFSLVDGYLVSNRHPKSDVITQISTSNIQSSQCQHDALTYINSVTIYSFQIIFHSSQLTTLTK